MNHTRRNHIQQFTARKAFIQQKNKIEEGKRNQKQQDELALTQRSPKGLVESNICFISPKKIAYFQNIDSKCLNEEERCVLVQNSKSGDKMFCRQSLKNPELQIDYKFIKKCLSPKVIRQPLFTRRGLESEQTFKNIKNKASKKVEQQKEFIQKIIFDLKLQVIEMSKLIEERDRQIQQKDLKISDLERQLFDRDRKMQTSSISFKSISTTIEQRIDRSSYNNSVLLMISFDQFQDKVGELQQKIKIYGCQFKKFQIQIDILRKNKYQFQKLESDLDKSNKKVVRLNKRIQILTAQNKSLQNQMLKCLVQIKSKNDESIDLTYSPDKYK